jgi:O-antigen/teichoic acid export membrane protein
MSNDTSSLPPLRRAALLSGISLGIGFGYSQIIRIISTIVLSRLLYPEALGLSAMVAVIMIGLTLLSDLGFRISVVQHPDGEDADFLNTAWTMQIIRGFILWLIACLLAWPAAYWRPNPAPDLLWLLPVMGFGTVFDGFTSTRLYVFSRRISQTREVIIEAVAQTVGVTTMICWAMQDRSINAIAGGTLLMGFVKMLLSHLLCPGRRNRLCWNRAAVRELWHVAKWVYLGTAFTFIATYADRLVVGFMSIRELGIYNLARQLADIPAELLAVLGGKLIFPVYSRIIRSESDLGSVFPKVHLLASGISALLVAGLLAIGPTVVMCMYDERYHDGVWMVRLLVIGSWLRMLSANAGNVFFAKGLVRYSAYCNAAKTASLLIFMPVGYFLDSNNLRGLILGFIAGDLVRYIVTVNLIARENLHILRNDLLWTLFVAISAAAGSILGERTGLLQVDEAHRRLAYLPRLVVEGGIVVVCWVFVVSICRQRGHFRSPSAPVDLPSPVLEQPSG